MENNYETMRMPEIRSIARERVLRGYSRLRKAVLIAFLQNNSRALCAHRRNVPPQPEEEEQPQGIAQPQRELQVALGTLTILS